MKSRRERVADRRQELQSSVVVKLPVQHAVEKPIQVAKPVRVEKLTAKVEKPDYFLIPLSGFLFLVGTGNNALYAWSIGQTVYDKGVMSLQCIVPEAVAFFLLPRAKTLWVTSKVRAVVCYLLWVMCFAYALENSYGFTTHNYTDAATARAERITPEVLDLQRRLEGVNASILSECVKRGDKCRSLETTRDAIFDALRIARAKVSLTSDPQVEGLARLVSRFGYHPSEDDIRTVLSVFNAVIPQLGAFVLMVAIA